MGLRNALCVFVSLLPISGFHFGRAGLNRASAPRMAGMATQDGAFAGGGAGRPGPEPLQDGDHLRQVRPGLPVLAPEPLNRPVDLVLGPATAPQQRKQVPLLVLHVQGQLLAQKAQRPLGGTALRLSGGGDPLQYRTDPPLAQVAVVNAAQRIPARIRVRRAEAVALQATSGIGVHWSALPG